MVIVHDYPFNCVNHTFMREFLSDLQPEFKLCSRNTLRTECIKIFREEKLNLEEYFGKLDCRFSLTSDLWTCNSGDRGFLAIIGHYIDDDWNLKKGCLFLLLWHLLILVKI